MRAQFIRGGDPSEVMDIGRYRSEGRLEDIFKKMHEEAKKSPNFESVTHIREGGAEPSFKIVSKFEKTVKKTFPAGEFTIRDKEQWTLYLTKDRGITMFDDLKDDEYEELTFEEFLKITRCREMKEAQNFERGKDPKQSMDIGMESKYGKMYELFVICHNLSTNSENFPYVSEIVSNPGKDPFFNIESVFYYTDDDDNKIPEQFVITLHPDSIECFNVITKDEENFRTEQKFIKLTTCFDEDDNGGWQYES